MSLIGLLSECKEREVLFFQLVDRRIAPLLNASCGIAWNRIRCWARKKNNHASKTKVS